MYLSFNYQLLINYTNKSITFNVLWLDSLATVSRVAGSGHAGRISAKQMKVRTQKQLITAKTAYLSRLIEAKSCTTPHCSF